MIDFKRLMAARFLFNFAVRMQAVIVGWLMWNLTKNSFQLGMIGLSEAVPALGIAIYAGYLVDRSWPLRIYRCVQLGSLVSATVVFVSQLPSMALSVHAQVLALYLASFITGASRGFSQPAMFSIVPRLLPRAQYSRASAWMSTAMQMASILGPAVGGLIFGWKGPSFAAGVPVAGLVLALTALSLIRLKIEPQKQQTGKSIKTELFSGAKFVWNHPILLPALTLDMISVLFGGVTALLPIFASEILFIGATGLGFLRAAPALGSMLMAYTLTKIDLRARAGTWLFVAVTGFGLCMLAFGLSTSYWLSLAVLAISGAFDGVSVVVRSSAVQLASPDSMRGRISAINSIFIGSSNELGEFESGVAASIFGYVPAVVLGAVACLATVAVLGVRSPKLRKLNLIELEAS